MNTGLQTETRQGLSDKAAQAVSEPINLLLWRDFQEALSALLDVPISLYDRRGNVLAQSKKETTVCDAIRSHKNGADKCREVYSKAISQVLEKGKIYIYKCHSRQYVFAVPVFLDVNCSFVVIGGHAYLSGSEEKEFFEGTAAFAFDSMSLMELRKRLKTIPARSVFSIPNIINNLAVPFLKCLYLMSQPAAESDLMQRNRLKSFNALEEVYRSLAPVLDREELYETILAKSSELVGAERGTLMILDSKDNVLCVKASVGIDKKITEDLRIKAGEGISGATVANGIPVVVKDIEREAPARKNMPAYKTKSFISLPLKFDNRVIGVINIADKISGEVFSEEDLHLLVTFANYASIALERGAYYSMSEELKLLSMTDPLTGLFNRRYFHERIFEEIERVKRHSECFTTFIIDIDNFKGFNDRYGHTVGDEVLKSVARSIRDAVRSMDVVARYGGEEFAVILPHTSKKDSEDIAERMRKDIERNAVATGDQPARPTVSIGVAEFPHDAGNIDDLINRADRAMYMAKRLGKNRVVLHEG
ncbi:MAG: diguanylate cyclase [Deltaproteobacteria bacterium]